MHGLGCHCVFSERRLAETPQVNPEHRKTFWASRTCPLQVAMPPPPWPALARTRLLLLVLCTCILPVVFPSAAASPAGPNSPTVIESWSVAVGMPMQSSGAYSSRTGMMYFGVTNVPNTTAGALFAFNTTSNSIATQATIGPSAWHPSLTSDGGIVVFGCDGTTATTGSVQLYAAAALTKLGEYQGEPRVCECVRVCR